MKKMNLTKLLVTFAMSMLVSAGLFAQVNATADYQQYDGAAAVPNNVDYVTQGATMTYYVEPDPTYHGNYNALGGWDLDESFTWTWTMSTDPGVTGASDDTNTYTGTFSALGDYVLEVFETAPAAYGGCADVTPTTINITAVAAPSAVISTADVNACGNQVAATFDIDITEGALPDALKSYAFDVRQTVYTYDGAAWNVSSADASYINFSEAAKVNASLATGAIFTGWSLAGATATVEITTPALNVVSSSPTRYVFNLQTSSDATAGAGIISAISQKSEYEAGSITAYAFGGDVSVTFQVNPEPQTGDIYHIPNNYAY
jgi:hypothetical protein